MKFYRLFLIGLVSLGLFSCTDDNDAPSAAGAEKTAFFSLKLSFPQNVPLRAGEPTTGNEGGDSYQDGLATEQRFSKVSVIIVSASNNQVTDILNYTASDFVPEGNTAVDDDDINPTQTPKNYLAKESKLVTAGDAKVYVFLNPSQELLTNFLPIGKLLTSDVIEMASLTNPDITTGIAKPDNFLMGNAEPPVVQTIDGIISDPTVVTVAVERAAVKLVENTGTATFNVSSTHGAGAVTVTLTNYAYNNLNKRYYLLKNVQTRSDAGAVGGSYVVDPNFVHNEYKAYAPAEPWFANDFFVIGNQGVTKPFVTTPDITYGLENTMISFDQYENRTTSIVYKAAVSVDGTSGTTVYLYKDVLYKSYADLQAVYDAEQPLAPLSTVFTEAELDAAYNSGSYSQAVHDLNVKLMDHGVYAYYEGVSYYRWHIKHWDQDVLLGRMEFGLVRNNVYYLEVTGIRNIGVPWVPGGPETPDPGPRPDEEDNAYLIISVNVLPWTVRFNNIEF